MVAARPRDPVAERWWLWSEGGSGPRDQFFGREAECAHWPAIPLAGTAGQKRPPAATPNIATNDEKYSWSLLRGDWSNRPAFEALKALPK